jgi:hypothetical protein
MNLAAPAAAGKFAAAALLLTQLTKPMLRPLSVRMSGMSVVEHALEVDDGSWVVSYHPGIVTRGEQGNLARYYFFPYVPL